MAEYPLVLSDEEQQYLITHLRSTLQETRVESHHTRTAAYRERVRREEALLRGLLAKLGVEVSARPPKPVAVAVAAADEPIERPRGLEG
jgi:hypothetical protein